MNFSWSLILVLSIFTKTFSFPIGYNRSNISEESEDSQNSEILLKIVGGKNAEYGKTPHIISLQYTLAQRNKYYHTCGGAILSPEWVITAGHCINTAEIDKYEVSAGRYNFKTNEALSEQRRKIWRTFVHPEFLGGISQNDIALIQLETPLIFTQTVNKIQLPTQATEKLVGNATLYGWGSTSNGKLPVMPNVLQTMEAPLISTAKCRELLRAGDLISNKTLCSGPVSGQPSACSGDSGSALSKNDVLLGVVSWG